MFFQLQNIEDEDNNHIIIKFQKKFLELYNKKFSHYADDDDSNIRLV